MHTSAASYGRVCSGSDPVRVGVYTIHLSPRNGVSVYRRCGPEGCVERLISSPCIDVEPLPPVFYPEKLSSHVMVKLRRPLIVDSSSKCSGYIVLEVDAGVFTPSGSLFDVFPPSGRARYALYGGPDSGVIARYLVSDVYPYDPRPLFYAVALLEVSNRFRSAVEVSRIVVPAFMVRMAYSGARVIAWRIRLDIVSDQMGVVTVSKPRIPPGFREPRLPLPEAVASPEKARYPMIHGF